jgi:hypothetical protein
MSNEQLNHPADEYQQLVEQLMHLDVTVVMHYPGNLLDDPDVKRHMKYDATARKNWCFAVAAVLYALLAYALGRSDAVWMAVAFSSIGVLFALAGFAFKCAAKGAVQRVISRSRFEYIETRRP